jgi:hypothetical protein
MQRSRLFTLCLLLTLLTISFFALTPQTHAKPQGASLLVTRLDDPAPDSCNAADCSLREAVMASNLTAGTDVISITIPGTIELSIFGPNEDASATGDLDLIDDVYIVGQGSEVTIVDANQLDRVFDYTPMVPTNAPVFVPNGVPNSLEAMTITGGNMVVDTNGAGGGVRIGSGRDTGLFGVVVRGNVATSDATGLGGGVGNDGGLVAIYNSAIVNNTAQNAGGISNLDGTVRLVNSTVSGNTAIDAVGGVLNLAVTNGVTATLIISDSTIAYNNMRGKPTGSGAGVDSTAFPGTGIAAITTIANTIIANNTGQSQCYIGGEDGGMIVSAGYNLSGDASCNFTAGSDLQNTDPLLGALMQSDGTYYHALNNGSPALDSGSTTFTEDQRGAIRPVDLPGIPNTANGSDRGAIEMAAEPPTAVALAHLSVMSDNGFMRGAVAGLALAALGIVIALRRR